MELSAGCFHHSTEPRAANTQVEVVVQMDKAGVDDVFVQAISVDTDLGSSIPPLRTLAFEALTDSDGCLYAASCVLVVQGQKAPVAKAVWFRRDPTPDPDAMAWETPGNVAPANTTKDWSEISVEVYDPCQEEPPTLFMHEDEAVLLEHL